MQLIKNFSWALATREYFFLDLKNALGDELEVIIQAKIIKYFISVNCVEKFPWL